MRLENPMSRVLKIMKWAAISTAVLLVLLVLFWKPILRFVFHDLPFMGKSFDSTVWSSALSCKNDRDCLGKEMACLRSPMYRDLERNYLLVGAPKATVTNLSLEAKSYFASALHSETARQSSFVFQSQTNSVCSINPTKL